MARRIHAPAHHDGDVIVVPESSARVGQIHAPLAPLTKRALSFAHGFEKG